MKLKLPRNFGFADVDRPQDYLAMSGQAGHGMPHPKASPRGEKQHSENSGNIQQTKAKDTKATFKNKGARFKNRSPGSKATASHSEDRRSQKLRRLTPTPPLPDNSERFVDSKQKS